MKPSDNVEHLFEGIQNSKIDILSKFSYTCVCWLGSPVGTFSKHVNNFKSILAAGTEDGIIVIYGYTGDDLVRVSLLCGHTTRITHLTIGLNPDVFYSASLDGTICLWNMYDGSCAKQLLKIFEPGDLRISNVLVNPNVLFLWNFGMTGSGYILNKKQLRYPIPQMGIIAFSPLPSGNIIVAIRGRAFIYEPKFDKIMTSIKIKSTTSAQYFATPQGLIGLDHGKIIVYDNNLYKIYKYTAQIEEYDSFFWAEWNEERTIHVCSYGGVQLSINPQPGQTKVEILKNKFSGIVVSASFNKENQVAVVLSEKYIAVTDNGKITRSDSGKSAPPIFIPNFSLTKSLEADGNVVNYIKNDEVEKKYIHPNSTVTAITSVTLRRSKYVITGAQDGTVCIFTKSDSPFLHFPCVSTRIIGFAHTPFVTNGSPRIVAVGETGELCLFNLSESRLNYLTPAAKILSISVDEKTSLIFVTYQGHRILAYNTEDPEYADERTFMPPQTVQVWQRTSVLNGSEIVTSGIVRVAGMGIGYTVFDASRLKEADDKSIGILSQKVFSLSVVPPASGSFVLVGDNAVPTFFYPPHQLSGKIVYDTSPLSAATHWIACNIIAGELGGSVAHLGDAQPSDECIPFFVGLVFSKSSAIAHIATSFLILAIRKLSSAQCMHMIPMLIKETSISSLSDPEKLLLGIVGSIQISLIPAIFVKPLFETLVGYVNSGLEVKHIALMALVVGYSSWVRETSHTDLCRYLLKQLLKDNMNEFRKVIAIVASENFDVFLPEFRSLFAEVIQPEGSVELDSLLSVFANACFRAKNGPVGAITLAGLISEFPSQSGPLSECLVMFENIFQQVARNGSVVAVGNEDGTVSIVNGKNTTSIKALEKAVSAVSISPNADMAVCFSIADGDYAVISLKRKGGIFGNRLTGVIERGKIAIEGSGDKVDFDWNNGNVTIQLK